MASSSRVRWYIAGLLCLSSTLNYLDRQTLSVLAATIQRELHLTDVQYLVRHVVLPRELHDHVRRQRAGDRCHRACARD